MGGQKSYVLLGVLAILFVIMGFEGTFGKVLAVVFMPDMLTVTEPDNTPS